MSYFQFLIIKCMFMCIYMCTYIYSYIFQYRFFFLIFKFIIYLLFLFLAALGLRFCARAFSSCGEWGPLFIAVRGPLTITASLVAEQRLQTLRLSSCGSRAQLLRGMWDLPRPGLEPVSPALSGRFSTTAPPGKPVVQVLCEHKSSFLWGKYCPGEYLLGHLIIACLIF